MVTTTAHQQVAEAASAPAPQSVSDKAADFENFLFDGEDEEQNLEAESEGDPESDLELEADEEQEEQAPEPETAIDAPVSLNAEEKAVFAQLPKEAQDAWAASEARRNTQVQETTTKAAEAQRTAEARAAVADAEAKALYGQQLEQFVILLLGINEHYNSMSRGVIDTRDVLYFLGLISIFILFTKTILESRKW